MRDVLEGKQDPSASLASACRPLPKVFLGPTFLQLLLLLLLLLTAVPMNAAGCTRPCVVEGSTNRLMLALRRNAHHTEEEHGDIGSRRSGDSLMVRTKTRDEKKQDERWDERRNETLDQQRPLRVFGSPAPDVRRPTPDVSGFYESSNACLLM